MSALKDFFHDKQAREEWAQFVIDVLNQEALKRTYAGRSTAHVKEAYDLIQLAFKELNEMFTERKPKPRRERAV